MKLIIAGSRTIGNLQEVSEGFYDSPFVPTEIVSGGAKGVDSLGERFAIHILEIPYTMFRPNWELHGKKAGILRNIEMGNYADALLAIWDGKSKGTKHMIDYMFSLKKPVYIHIPDDT